jgi:hypothetical protein
LKIESFIGEVLFELADFLHLSHGERHRPPPAAVLKKDAEA